MIQTIPSSAKFATTRLFPNGEMVIFRNKLLKEEGGLHKYQKTSLTPLWASWLLYLDYLKGKTKRPLFLGLSLLQNFDNMANPLLEQVCPLPKRVVRYGANGISRRAARTVRCAAYLLEKRFGRENLTFATVTVPSLPIEQMTIIHHRWNEVVERYRLLILRRLEHKKARKHLLTVSEIQPKRHEKSGVPVLHLHSLFVGRPRFGHWFIDTEEHDYIWRKAIESVIGPVGVSFKAAAQFKMVHSSAANYIGKYMSKCAASVITLKDDGLLEWLPRQWWNCTRELVRAVKRETVDSVDITETVMVMSKLAESKVWHFVGHVSAEIAGIPNYWLATYGRVTASMAKFIRKSIRGTPLTQCVTL